MIEVLLLFVIALLMSFTITQFLLPRLKKVGILGKDINKQGQPEVAEMGGLAIIAGATVGILTAIFFQTFFSLEFNLIFILAALITIHSIAFIGVVDDLVNIPQIIKALSPLLAAIPLVVVKAAGSTAINFPLIGVIDLGLIYVLFLIPIGIAVASNLTNMLAGFNGMETKMGIVIFATTSILAAYHGKIEMLVISLSMLGALVGFLCFNIYPSKIFPGDVGNLTIGASLATAVIVGNLETAGAILVIPYVIDFFIKAINKFPSRGWGGIYNGGKLYSPPKPVGLAQYIMKLSNGITEKKLAFVFMLMECVCAIIVLALFLRA
ncbi:hypothetical protein KKB44_01390 [Candidatus Micrarchaeota archaeon]|nr:hypothetical protein [Candidatus Micrarchaeota archaeon]